MTHKLQPQQYGVLLAVVLTASFGDALLSRGMAQIGPVGLAVTTNMTINFMRKPPAGDLVARCHLLKLGRRLAVGEARLHAADGDDLVAHATGTYAIPPAKVS